MPVWKSESVGVSVSLISDPACSHREWTAGAAATSGWVPTGQEAEEVLSGGLKIMSREVMGQYCSLSHTTESLIPLRIKCVSYICI